MARTQKSVGQATLALLLGGAARAQEEAKQQELASQAKRREMLTLPEDHPDRVSFFASLDREAHRVSKVRAQTIVLQRSYCYP